MQRFVGEVFVHNAVLDYAVQLVHATRVPDQYGLPHVAARVAYGASPRASLGLVAAGRALALLRGRNYVLPQDVVAIAPEVLRHRVVLSYEALAEGIDADRVVEEVLKTIPVPQIAPSQDQMRQLPAEDTA
jgi:MoxR-like ATPase